jgi:outer membrane receptor protein involved in Fe transport
LKRRYVASIANQPEGNIMVSSTRTAVRGSALLTGLALTTLGAPAANAQQDVQGAVLEEIIVTAQKREESLQDVPISVNAVSGEKLAEAGIVRLDDLRAYVPNLQVTETGIANNFYIRGIGSGLNQGFEQSVSIFADGIYRGRGHQSRMAFLDLERVEVLRGPQPILFGKNAIAGAVNLISAKPTQEFEGGFRVAHETEYDETIADLTLSGPLSDSIGARLALRSRQADGYLKNLTIGRNEPARDELGGRLTLDFEPSESFDASLRLEAGQFDVKGRQVEIFGEEPSAPLLRPSRTVPGGTVTNPPIPGRTYGQILAGAFLQDASVLNNTLDYKRSSNGEYSNLDSKEYALTMNWRFGNGLTLTSVTGYSAYNLDETCDCDFTGANVFTAGIKEDYSQTSQELRITSDPDQRLSWIAGAFWQEYELKESDYIFVPANSVLVPLLNGNPALPMGSGSAFANTANPRLFTQDSELYAAFAQATFNLSDSLRISAGGRYSSEDKSGSRANNITAGLGGAPLPTGLIDVLYNAVFRIQRHSVSGERSESKFSPLVNLQYDFGADSMAYLSWSKGNKSGGYDARSNQSPANGGSFEYGPEEATNYEFGVKASIGRSAQINAAVFFTDYEDLQTSAFDGSIGFNVGSGSAEVKGVEIEGRWQATERLYLSGSVAWLDFEWTRYDGQCYFGAPASLFTTGQPGRSPGNCNYDGFTNQLAPEITAVVGGEYRWPLTGNLELRTGVDVTYTDDYLVSLTLDPRAVQDSYAKVNARIALRGNDGAWEIALSGRNLTDEQTISYAGDTPLSGSIFAARSYYGFVDAPMTVAIEGAFKF